MLSSLYYQFPICTDRYTELVLEIGTFIDVRHGLDHVIAIGAFEIGMEHLIFQLAEHFNAKIHMTAERRRFLENMGLDNDNDLVLQNFRRKLLEHPEEALFHVLHVEEINIEVRALPDDCT